MTERVDLAVADRQTDGGTRPRRRSPGRLAAVAAGALPTLAYPAPSWWWLAWFALVPLTLVVLAAPTRREGLVRAWWGLTVFQTAVQYWLAPDIGPALVLFSFLLAALWLPWAWAVYRLLAGPLTGRRAGAALVVVPSAWTFAETVRSWQSLGGPWALLGTTQWKEPALLATAAIGGVWLTGFLIAAANVAIVIAVRTVENPVRVAAAAVIVACLAAGPLWAAVRPGQPVTRTIRVAVVQPGVLASPAAQQAFEQRTTAQLAGQPLDLVVWGESSVTDTSLADPSELAGTLPALVRTVNADILVNGHATPAGGSDTYNQSVLVGPSGPIGDYAKMRLVPFGEYIPFRFALGWLTSVSKAAPDNLVRGHGTTVMSTVSAGGASDPLTIGPLICFESAFPDMARTEVNKGAQLLVYQSNTSTFQGSWAQQQHAALTAVRAVETGRPAVQASLTGVSAVFDAAGHRLAWYPASQHGSFITSIPLVSGATFYDRSGNWLPVAAFCILGIAALQEARQLRAGKRARIPSTR